MKGDDPFGKFVSVAVLIIGLVVLFHLGSTLGWWPSGGLDPLMAQPVWPPSAIAACMAAVLAFVGQRYVVTKRLVQIERSFDQRLVERTRQLDDTVQELTRQAQDLEKHSQSLIRTAALAEKSAVTKDLFLAGMSHELRTPLHAVLGFADMLAEPASLTSNERRNALTVIRKTGRHLLSIVNDILDLSTIQSGTMIVEPAPCSSVQVAQEVLCLMQPQAIEKDLALAIEYRTSIPAKIRTDARRLRQILINLINNSVKFTNSGSVRLVVAMVNQADDPDPKISFEVIDTGVGMTRAQQARAFDAFAKADAPTSRQFGGTGLGLMLSKSLGQLLGGDVNIRSAPNMGSTFSVTLPTGPLKGVAMVQPTFESQSIEPEPEPELITPDPVYLSGRVLLAEDGRDGQWLISYLLRNAGVELTIVPDGNAAYERATQAQEDNQPFDVILMDMQMPGLDGFAATSKLRTHGYTRPIVAVTAQSMKGDREKCLSAGCSEYLPKPVDKTTLLSTLARYMPTRKQPSKAGLPTM